MKKLICVALLLALVSLAFAQEAKDKSPLQSMVETELAFARMAAEQGIRPSFTAFIAEDGILFRSLLTSIALQFLGSESKTPFF